MFRNIEWLFFDVGSTLINEEKVYKHIFYDIADATGESYEKIYDMAIRFYKENKKGDLELWYSGAKQVFGRGRTLFRCDGMLRNFKREI